MQIRVSTSWCDGGLDGAQPFQKVDVDCDYWWYIFMTFADAVAVGMFSSECVHCRYLASFLSNIR